MLPTVRTILFATDLDPEAEDTFKYVARLAQHYDARIVLLHVLEPLSAQTKQLVDTYLPSGTVSADTIRRQAREELAAQVRSRVDRYRDEMGSDGDVMTAQKTEVRIAEGLAAEVILEQVRDTGADLVVMGTHRRSWLSEMLLGSVAHRVLKQSAIPVLLAPVN